VQVADVPRERILATSVTGFAVFVGARSDGLTDEEIAHLVGFSTLMVEAVAGRSRT
jgi:hypothetical protein